MNRVQRAQARRLQVGRRVQKLVVHRQQRDIGEPRVGACRERGTVA